ncbi:cysteine synthase A [Miniphocaeibacter halophilus]|uniref:Cysteine synthase A n=1 Tax=Miniphocaeibacter halophilus TaxID=2931922 RepID=A0AC61MSB4_9FIRM|nr:cysteine synthase A [Miniphocaeibacter halophilus]QQK07091.1 cysteine synthase A [Miniphocaeibacter halophilus]
MNINNSILDLIGNTPIMKLNNIERHFNLKSNLFGKLEYLNPEGSIKDRVAKQMIEQAEKEGRINKDTIIIEPTSGNTGIGLAAIAAVKGYKMILTMPETMSEERRNILKAFGAEIVLTEGSKGMKGAIDRAKELSKEYTNSFIPSQFENKENPKAHKITTGPEIWKDMDGNIDVLVAGVGTGGTITGVGEYLKEKNKNIEIVAVEPLTSAVLSGDNPGPHEIQGIGAGFIPSILNRNIYDEIVKVDNEVIYEYGKILAKKEGLLLGLSSAAALYGAVEISKKEKYNEKNIVIIFPDSGDRYFSTRLFN